MREFHLASPRKTCYNRVRKAMTETSLLQRVRHREERMGESVPADGGGCSLLSSAAEESVLLRRLRRFGPDTGSERIAPGHKGGGAVRNKGGTTRIQACVP